MTPEEEATFNRIMYHAGFAEAYKYMLAIMVSYRRQDNDK